jgi:hypothetical protein
MTCKKEITALVRVLLLLSAVVNSVKAQDDSWRDEMQYLRYSPRYFGPNAFPVPELRDGRIATRTEVELRGEYHAFEGDRTKDIYARLFVPVADGRAGLEVSYIFYEYYNMNATTVSERHAAGGYWDSGAHGDVVVSSFYRILQSAKWADITMEASLKTASGNRLVDARYTDAATYWFDVNIGRYICRNEALNASLRVQGLLGFYCWMTNDMVHRQNDAVAYSLGFSGEYGHFSFSADAAGLYGYEDNGDRPVQIRTKLNCEFRKNILSLRYKYGMKDCLYNSVSVAFIREF